MQLLLTSGLLVEALDAMTGQAMPAEGDSTVGSPARCAAAAAAAPAAGLLAAGRTSY
jgi:hypothetical protein